MKKYIPVKIATLIFSYIAILFLTSMKLEEFNVWISGQGTSANPVESGKSYTYTLERTIGYPNEFVKDIIWSVEKGKIEGTNTGTLRVNVIWDKNERSGTIIAKNVFKDTLNTKVTVSSNVFIKTTEAPPAISPTLSISTMSPTQYIPFICSVNFDAQGKTVEYIRWSTENSLVIVSGQGSNTINAYFNTFSLTTIKCDVKISGDSKIYSASQAINVIRSTAKISGPELICPNTTASFILQDLPSGCQINWSVTEGLSIVSGQGSTTINLKSNGMPNSSTLTAKISRNGTTIVDLSHAIRTNTPYVETVTGPSSIRNGDAYFAAAPIFSENVCDYEWLVGGSSYKIEANRHSAHIYFYQYGAYRVGCRTKFNSCTASQAPVFMDVYYGYAFMTIYNESTQSITISENKTNTDLNSTIEKSSSICELYNSLNGQLIIKKTIMRDMGIIDVSNIPKGVYILKIQTDNDGFESHKILIK